MTDKETTEDVVKPDAEAGEQEKADNKKKKSKKLRGRKNKIEEKYHELQLQYEELKDKQLRLHAEFDNFRKRSLREKLDYMKTAAQGTMREILPFLDDFDRARASAQSEDSEEQFTDGVELLYQKIYKILTDQGLKAMETDGETFDPELHSAVTNAPAPSEDMVGKILHTAEKGYTLNDKIIRHAKVVVGS